MSTATPAGKTSPLRSSKRLGKGLEWAVAQARRIIHDNDVERLKQLLAEYPALLSWHGDDDDGGLLGMATGAYGDAGDPQREQSFTRAACAELLIDAGAVVMPSVCEGLLESRARGLLRAVSAQRPAAAHAEVLCGARRSRRAFAPLSTRTGAISRTVNEAFVCACRFDHEAVASLLLERSIALDPELGKHIDGSAGRVAFIKALRRNRTCAGRRARTVESVRHGAGQPRGRRRRL